ncbi:TIGR03086 family metal-binding protein [Mycolicibacterium psychrotolerans]|uniref:TIGR03086 family protein n=1 Tax=Mycolicibacterium psychrotolerans TaxID=216929 RepID=A0A7I7MHN8_9MYCO|nr:TIGR03086 family protein [Mycolicibacterium psychrotolerans]
MPTFSPQHRTAVDASIEVVAGVRSTDLDRTTPCAGWTLADLLAHMTAQHRGFAAAARGHGADADVWRPEPLAEAIAADPVGTYTAAARDVLAAFATPGADEALFALPEFGPDVTVAGETAMGFHFVDYVVHGWDVAASLGRAFTLPDDVIAAVTPLTLAVPDGDFRDADPSPFARALPPADGDGLARLLRHLGRSPDWSPAPR